MNLSIIFVMWQVGDIGLSSFSIECRGLFLGKGRTITLFRRLDTNPSLINVSYKSAITGLSSKIKVSSMRFKIPSGPRALLHFKARIALYASYDETSDSGGISGTSIIRSAWRKARC